MSRHGAYFSDIVPYRSRYYDKGKFGRMFPNLPPFAPDNKKVRDARIAELGRCIARPQSRALRATIGSIRLFEKPRVSDVIRLLGT